MSKFITFEGIDGSGKSTQLRLLEKYLDQHKIKYLSTREPGGSELGLKIRTLLLDGDHQSVEPEAELLLYAADRAQHVRRVIQPALDKGVLVLSDRFIDASVVYQGFVRGFDREFINTLNNFATSGLVPDVTLLFDLDVDVASQRSSFREKDDRLDSESRDFHMRVRDAYLLLAEMEAERFKIIPAEGSIEDTYDMMMSTLEPILI